MKPLDPRAWASPAAWRRYAEFIRDGRMVSVDEVLASLGVGECQLDSGDFPDDQDAMFVARSVGDYDLAIVVGACDAAVEARRAWAVGIAIVCELGAPLIGVPIYFDSCEIFDLEDAFGAIAKLLLVPEDITLNLGIAAAENEVKVSRVLVQCTYMTRHETAHSVGLAYHAKVISDFVTTLATAEAANAA